MYNNIIMNRFNFFVFAIIISVFELKNVNAQAYDCSKYCFVSCEKYFPGPEFESCVHANVCCSCSSSLSARNPLLYVILIGGVILLLFFCIFGYRYFQRSHNRLSHSPTVVADPVVPNAGVNNNTRRNADSGQTSRTIIRITRHTTLRGYVNPVSPQQIQGEISPEDVPPPPYSDCVNEPNPTDSERLVRD